jgi:hypothetical protein
MIEFIALGGSAIAVGVLFVGIIFSLESQIR